MNAMPLIWQYPPATGITLMQYGMQCIHANRQAMRHCHIPTDALPCDETKKIQTDMKQVIHSKFKPMKRDPLFVALSNQKGGVGKTTTSAALAAGFSMAGKKVLCIDLDPQGNLGFCLGLDTEGGSTILDVLKGDISIQKAISRTEGIDILPSDITLSLSLIHI